MGKKLEKIFLCVLYYDTECLEMIGFNGVLIISTKKLPTKPVEKPVDSVNKSLRNVRKTPFLSIWLLEEKRIKSNN